MPHNLKPPPAKNLPKSMVLEELARRKGLIAAEGSFRLEDYLFDKQLAFVVDPAPFKMGVTTRRAGKSKSCEADLTHTAIENPGVIVLYITLSRQNAKRLVWPGFKALNEQFKLGGIANESDLSIRYPNGSMLYLLGAADRTSIEDFRGMALKKVYLDEAQSFPAYIEQLIDDVLGPALMDHDGQLILIGTPGPLPSGYFYDLTRNQSWSHHSWSFFDNPKLPFLSKGLTHQNMLDRELNRRGVKASDPSIQREWFGQWVVDETALVYRYSPVCHYDGLPLGHQWTYLLGVDIGYNDADALALIAYSETAPATYLIEEQVTKKQDITGLVQQIEGFRARYDITKIVVDAGGLGKKIAEEINKRYKIPMVAAEKTRKVEYIELMNDAMRSGRLKIKANSLFAFDASKVEWDYDKSTPDRKVISDRFHSDICEALLYVWRESYSYSYEAPPKDVEYGTKAWGDKQAEDMFQHTLARLEEARGEEPEQLEASLEGTQSIDRPKGRYAHMFVKQKPPSR